MDLCRMPLRRGDFVQVMAGREKGKRAKVLRVLPKSMTVVLDGLHIVKRHKKAQGSQPGMITEKEGPVHASNCQIYCTSCNKPTRIKRLVDVSGPKRVVKRICKKCGAEIQSGMMPVGEKNG